MKRLSEIAYARSGDKGNSANIAVIAYEESDYSQILEKVTEERVAEHFSGLHLESVIRYEVPNLWALNFILKGALGGGGSRSLRSDAQGKALGQAILEMTIE